MIVYHAPLILKVETNFIIVFVSIQKLLTADQGLYFLVFHVVELLEDVQLVQLISHVAEFISKWKINILHIIVKTTFNLNDRFLIFYL